MIKLFYFFFYGISCIMKQFIMSLPDPIARENFATVLDSLIDSIFLAELEANPLLKSYFVENLSEVKKRLENIEKFRKTGKITVTEKEMTYAIKTRINENSVAHFLKGMDDNTLVYYSKHESIRKRIHSDQDLNTRYKTILL